MWVTTAVSSAASLMRGGCKRIPIACVFVEKCEDAAHQCFIAPKIVYGDGESFLFKDKCDGTTGSNNDPGRDRVMPGRAQRFRRDTRPLSTDRHRRGDERAPADDVERAGRV